MTGRSRNTLQLPDLVSSKRRRSKWIVPISLLALIGLLLGYCQTLERPFLERIFGDYQVIDAMMDNDTGKIVELGRSYNFSSQQFEVGIYDSRNPRRSISDLHKPIFSIVTHELLPEKIEYDGKCYFVRTKFRKDWTNVAGKWTDSKSGKFLCFYLLTPDGNRIENS